MRHTPKELAVKWVKRQKYSTSAFAWRVEAFAAGYRMALRHAQEKHRKQKP